MVPQLTDLREEILMEFHCSRIVVHPGGCEDVPESSLPVLLEWDEETRRGLCSTMSHMSAG